MAAHNQIYTLPNLISLARMALGPLVATLILNGDQRFLPTVFAIMVLAEASDFLDGFIARNFHQESTLGAFIDPVSDSIYRLSVFLAFFLSGWMPVWMFFTIYARDLIVPYLRTFAIQSGQPINVRWSGKIKAVAQGAAQLSVMAIMANILGLGEVFGGQTIHYILLAATLVSVYSLLDYSWEALRIIQG